MTKKQVLRALQFLRIVDEKNNLSITNLAIMITLGAMLMRPEIQAMDIGALVAALVAYQAKRFTGAATPETEAEDIKKIVADLQSKVVALQIGNQMKR